MRSSYQPKRAIRQYRRTYQGQSRKKTIMAEIKNKTEAGERALARLYAQLPKDINKRVYTPGCHASALSYLAEEAAKTVKFGTPEWRKAFKESLDGDWLYASNMKKYGIARGWLPKNETLATDSFE